MRALIVDDSRSMRAILAGWLRERGFEIIEAADGRAATEIFRRSGPLDLAVVHWNMPVMERAFGDKLQSLGLVAR